MLHYRKHPKEIKKAYAFAAVAKMEDVEFFYFSYHCVDFNKQVIKGWIYERGKWTRKEFKLPNVIINMSAPKTIEQTEIYKQLKNMTLFTSYPVGNKMKVYNKILKAKKFNHYLIPSVQINNSKDVATFLNMYNKAVIKPLSGNKGKNVFFIERMSHQSFIYTEGSNKNTCSQRELMSLIENLTEDRTYLVQRFIESKTKVGLTFDYRIHVQKNGHGKWEINLIYPRISGSSKMTSNISSGGYRGELISFLNEEYGEDWLTVYQLLEEFSLSFAEHFETLYKYSFDELGIDVTVDHDYQLWIFEVNWRPGSKHREFEVAKRLIPYCIFLANK